MSCVRGKAARILDSFKTAIGKPLPDALCSVAAGAARPVVCNSRAF
jgi:hypothetical protein